MTAATSRPAVRPPGTDQRGRLDRQSRLGRRGRPDRQSRLSRLGRRQWRQGRAGPV